MSIGSTELILILVLVLIIFGAGRMPQVLNQLGRGIREFREGTKDLNVIASRSETIGEEHRTKDR